VQGVLAGSLEVGDGPQRKVQRNQKPTFCAARRVQVEDKDAAMTLNQISAAIPISLGTILLWCTLRKDGAPKILKPTLAILAISGLIYAVPVLLLDDQSFQNYIGRRSAHWLWGFQNFVGGIGTGAVVCSLVHGHWKPGWLSWRKNKGCRENEAPQT
jgi:hypothetical protein